MYMDENPAVGIAGPRILNADMTVQPSCYGFPTPWNSLTHALGIDKVFRKSRSVTGLYDKYLPYDVTRDVDVLSGCFWIVRREALNQVGLLDEGFFFAWEDFDWSKRFKLAGWKAVYFVEAQAIHHHYASSAVDPVRFGFEAERSHLRYWRKYYGAPGMVYCGTLVFLRHLLQAGKAVILYASRPGDRKRNASKATDNLSVLLRFLRIGRGDNRK
jgi:hypothetical protein